MAASARAPRQNSEYGAILDRQPQPANIWQVRVEGDKCHGDKRNHYERPGPAHGSAFCHPLECEDAEQKAGKLLHKPQIDEYRQSPPPDRIYHVRHVGIGAVLNAQAHPCRDDHDNGRRGKTEAGKAKHQQGKNRVEHHLVGNGPRTGHHTRDGIWHQAMRERRGHRNMAPADSVRRIDAWPETAGPQEQQDREIIHRRDAKEASDVERDGAIMARLPGHAKRHRAGDKEQLNTPRALMGQRANGIGQFAKILRGMDGNNEQDCLAPQGVDIRKTLRRH